LEGVSEGGGEEVKMGGLERVEESYMIKRIRYILSALAIGLLLTSCKQKTVDGIFIDHTLYENQSYAENTKLRQTIHRTLEKNTKDLVELIKFPCGGAAGCYDLGFIMTQIIYKMGEKEFMQIAEKLGKDEANQLAGFIEVGLEYGYHYKVNKSNEERFQDEFPELYEMLLNK
jgi:hypothetical protein